MMTMYVAAHSRSLLRETARHITNGHSQYPNVYILFALKKYLGNITYVYRCGMLHNNEKVKAQYNHMSDMSSVTNRPKVTIRNI